MALLITLVLLLALEAAVACLLICPVPSVQKIGTSICGVLRTPSGVVVSYTIGAVLFALFGISAWELRSFGNKLDAVRSVHGPNVPHPVSESRMCLAQLSCVLAGCCLLIMALVRQLSECIVQNEKTKLSLNVLKKQAEGMRAEYLRQVDNAATTSANTTAGGKDDNADSELKPLRKQHGELVSQLAKMKRMLEDEAKAKAAAESSMEALKKQAEGLEREYDRVCDENNALERKMRSVTGGVGGSGSAENTPKPMWAHGDMKDD